MTRAFSGCLAILLLLTAACSSGGSSAGATPTPLAPTTGRALAPASGAGDDTSAPAAIEGKLVFTRTVGHDDQSYHLLTGGTEEQISEAGVYCCGTRTSPDGQRILVMPGEGLPQPTPVTGGTIALDGSDYRQFRLRDPQLNLVPEAWSPDGRVAFEGWDDADARRTGIYLARVDGSDLERVTRNTAGGHDVALDFSPDGKELIYYQQTSTDSDTDGSLWIVRLRDLRARRLTTSSSPPSWWARWSPDGRQIIFASERLSEQGHIYSIRPDGSGLTKIFTDTTGRFPIHPTWSPDGRRILFALNPINDQFRHVPNELYLIDADGENLRLALGGEDFKSQLEWRS